MLTQVTQTQIIESQINVTGIEFPNSNIYTHPPPPPLLPHYVRASFNQNPGNPDWKPGVQVSKS